MTPREKAVELVQKFEGLGARPFDGKSNIRIDDFVRQRALICCDEIINALKIGKARELIVDDPNLELQDMKMIGGIEYWARVKIQINFL